MAKFYDKLATQALESALAEHAKITSRQCEIETARTQLYEQLTGLEKDIEAMGNNEFECPDNLSTAAEIDAAIDEHETRRDALKNAHALATKKLGLVNDARTRISLEVPLATEAVRTARVALAASYERWVLNQSAIKDAMALLAASRAVWNCALAGCLDVDAWCRDLLWDCLPTREQNAAADSLLKLSDA